MFEFLDPFLPKKMRSTNPIVATVRLTGVIGEGSSFKAGLNLASVKDALEKAFEMNKIDAVAISINSPGGSPVQSALIHDRIRALSKKHDVSVYTFAEDVAASGGYWIVLAGDEVYAHETSIIGSIGVIMSTFGVDRLMKKWDIDRRVYTSGKNKNKLDMFMPENKQDVALINQMSGDIHDAFKQHVRDRRKDKLKSDDETLFNGDFWAGKRAKDHGLIDGIGDVYSVMKEKFGEQVRFKDVSIGKKGLLKKMFGSSTPAALAGGNVSDIGVGVAHGLAQVAEEKALWNRFGL
ncbi:MAG: S49 family peptidase [Rhizobiales bacterium]|nr:S49 family peptidase [Hyphomicrobiales bacterium]NRB13462.1 S49 family peptidase [Hyphomicrobiales bacterium]